MHTIEMHFASGWDFFDDYKLFIGAIVVPRSTHNEGEQVELICRFGNDDKRHAWVGTVLKVDVTTASGERGCVVKLNDAQRAEVEQTVWAYARGARKRREERVDLPLSVELIIAHRDKDDGRRVVAQDVSKQGCKLTADQQSFAVDDDVILTWSLGRAAARVCWVDGNTFGVHFEDAFVDTKSLLTPDVS